MISWIQNTFQHHFRTVFAVLLGLLIISFVFVIGPQSGFGNNSGGSRSAMFFGYDLASQVDKQRILQDARVSAILNYGSADASEDQLLDYGKQRVTGLHLANELGIPKPSKAQLEKSILEMPIFSDGKGGFDAKRYEEFGQSLKKNTSGFMTTAEVARVMEEDCRRAEVAKLLAGEGYVLEQSVAADLARVGTEWTVRYARFDYASFAAPAQPTDEQLEKYFKENAALFEVGPRAVVRLVTFPAAAFAADVTFTEEELARYFESMKFRYQADSTTPGTPPAAPELAAVRPKVEADLRVELAGQAATKAASDFGYAIFTKKLKKDSPEILELAKSFRGQVSNELEFTEEKGPSGINWTPAATTAAFLLADDRFFSDAIEFGSDQGVLLWSKTLPGYAPKIDEVRADVVTRYLVNEKRKAFGEAGIAWKKTIADKIAAGASFEDAVKGLLGAPQVEVKNVGPFTLRQPPADANSTVLGAIEGLGAGQISDFLPSSQDAGFIVQVLERKAPAVDATNPLYADLRRRKARQSAGYYAFAVQRDLAAEEQKAYAGTSVAR